MADANLDEFQRRLRRIESDHRSLSSAYIQLEERDGILVPVRKVRPKRGFPWRGLFLVLMVFVGIKALMLAHVGPITYIERHAKLENGSMVEQMAAWTMRPDVVTVFLADQIAPVLKKIDTLSGNRW